MKALAILGFHSIGPPSPGGWETWFYIPEAVFVGFLSCLRDNRWTVIDLATLLRGLEDPEVLPPRAALLTFDDGFRSMMRTALPVLRRFGYPAVVFVPTDFIGRHYPLEPSSEPPEPVCDWDELRELARSGVSVQSHCASHRALSALDADAQERELQHSKAVLESGLGQAVEVVAFPYGDPGSDPQLTSGLLRRTGYKAACLYSAETNAVNPVPVPDAYRLRRLTMGPDTDLARLLVGANPGVVPYEREGWT